MKLIAVLLLVAVGMLAMPAAGRADAESPVSFSIRPTQGSPDRPETFSYFSHELAAGSVVTDEALLINESDEPITVEVYAADGVTAINGGTAFTARETAPTRVAGWLSLPESQVTLAGGEERLFPFTITVPADASAGQHVAGIVIEATAETSDAGSEQFQVRVLHRSGVAVMVDVPGLRVPQLEITGVAMRDQSEDGATFVVSVENRGNILVKGDGTLKILDAGPAGASVELAEVPFVIDTVLPGSSTFLYVHSSLVLQDGNYQLAASLSYRAVNGAETGSAELSQHAEVRVTDGQPDAGDARALTAPGASPTVTSLSGTPLPDSGTAVRYFAAAGVVVAAVAALAVLWRRRAWSR